MEKTGLELPHPSAFSNVRKGTSVHHNFKLALSPTRSSEPAEVPHCTLPFKNLGSCALIFQSGRRLIQVMLPKGLEECKKLAEQMKKILEREKACGIALVHWGK